MIVITIPGPPVPWKAHAGYGRRSFNPRWREKEYIQAKIKEQYKGLLIDEAVSLDTRFYMPIPKTLSKKKREEIIYGIYRPTKRPDCTNMRKFYEDCLNGIVLKDDSLVVSGVIEKWYCSFPRTEVHIELISRRGME